MFNTLINLIEGIYINLISKISSMFDSFILFFVLFLIWIIIIIFKSKIYKDENENIPSFNYIELYELPEDENSVENAFNSNKLEIGDDLGVIQGKSSKIDEIVNNYLLTKSESEDSFKNVSERDVPPSISNNMLISADDLNSNWRSLRQSGCSASIYFYAACSLYYIIQNEMIINYHNISDNGSSEDTFWHETKSYNIRLGWDSLSKIFVLLVGFIFTFAFIANWSNIELLGIKGKNFILNLVGMEFLLIIVFLVTNMLLFYIFFESILPGLFLLVGIYGAQQKIKAAFYLFLYTLLGSLFMLLVLLKLYADGASLDMRKSIDSNITRNWSIAGWMGLIFAFAVKTPLIPVHTWLPLAHSDANVSGSIILASVVLKLALYGILRLLIGILIAGVILIPTMLSWASLSTGYASLTTIRQFDLKVLVAYSSIAHMGSTLIGAFSNELPGIFGSILFGLAHGVVSPGLFILVGAVLYDRSGSRNIIYYRGLTLLLPVFAVCFLLLVFGNMGVPLTGNFLGEFLSYLGAYQENVFIVSIAALSIIFSAVYSIYMYNRVMSGSLSPYVSIIPDMFRKEFAIIAPLLFATFLLGIYPYFISYDIEYGLSSILLFSCTAFTFYINPRDRDWEREKYYQKLYKFCNYAHPFDVFGGEKEVEELLKSWGDSYHYSHPFYQFGNAKKVEELIKIWEDRKFRRALTVLGYPPEDKVRPFRRIPEYNHEVYDIIDALCYCTPPKKSNASQIKDPSTEGGTQSNNINSQSNLQKDKPPKKPRKGLFNLIFSTLFSILTKRILLFFLLPICTVLFPNAWPHIQPIVVALIDFFHNGDFYALVAAISKHGLDILNKWDRGNIKETLKAIYDESLLYFMNLYEKWIEVFKYIQDEGFPLMQESFNDFSEIFISNVHPVYIEILCDFFKHYEILMQFVV